MTMADFLNEHFWALWWLAVFFCMSLPSAIVIRRSK